MRNLEKIFFVAVIFAGLSAPGVVKADQVMLGEKKSQAIIHAVDRFHSDGYVSDGYQIIVREKYDAIEVVFVPPLLEGKDLFSKDASNLPEVHYYLDPSGKNIVRRLFGK